MTVEFLPPDRYLKIEYTLAFDADTAPVISHDLRGDRFQVMFVTITEWRAFVNKPSTLRVGVQGHRLRKRDGGVDRRGGSGGIVNEEFKASVAEVFRTKCRRVDPNEQVLIKSDDIVDFIRQRRGPLGPVLL
jgi:hypothetical protein